ncbi:MAG TPA: hypothetical protein PLV92_01740 [Pirellulaceae bacterium]|nr:hypothetical protein [Pirellulaceae bacterium]
METIIIRSEGLPIDQVFIRLSPGENEEPPYDLAFVEDETSADEESDDVPGEVILAAVIDDPYVTMVAVVNRLLKLVVGRAKTPKPLIITGDSGEQMSVPPKAPPEDVGRIVEAALEQQLNQIVVQ